MVYLIIDDRERAMFKKFPGIGPKKASALVCAHVSIALFVAGTFGPNVDRWIIVAQTLYARNPSDYDARATRALSMRGRAFKENRARL